MQLLFGAQPRNYNTFDLSGGSLYLKGIDIGDVKVPLLRIITIGSAFVLMILLWLSREPHSHGEGDARDLLRSRGGRDDGDRHRPRDRVHVHPRVGARRSRRRHVRSSVPTTVSIGFVSGLKGFTAAVIGGIGSVPGAMAGGLILGLAESYTAGYVSTKWSDLVVFLILIAFMILRPQGLLGRADIRKV